MSSTKRLTRRWFDRRAGSYESGFTSRWRDPVQRESLAALDLTADDRMLDVGCGTGSASRAAAATAGTVVGIDLSPKMSIGAGTHTALPLDLTRVVPHGAGLTQVMLRRMMDGGFAIVRGVAAV